LNEKLEGMTNKTKKGPTRHIRRFFSFKKKKNQSSTKDASSTSKNNAKASVLPWSPENIFGELNGIPIPSNMHGSILLAEVGGVDCGWILDFSGEGGGEHVVISRYQIPNTQANKNTQKVKAPNGPPRASADVPVHVKNGFESLPWIWYKDRKTFSKIETGKLSDMVAYVTGRIAVSGDDSKWTGIDSCWKEAKHKITERRKNLDVEGGDGQVIVDEDDDEEEDIDEEARIIATFKPEVEPTDPRTKEFWMRHVGTDSLVASYLFLVSSVSYTFLCLYHLQSSLKVSSTDVVMTVNEASKQAHSLANFTAAVFFTLASVYFIKLSYPETTMLMAYHAMTMDTTQMSIWERYFTANEMLIALWLITAAVAIPLAFVALYELVFLNAPSLALKDFIIILIAVPLTGVMNIAAMPDCMRANNGQGSRFFFDGVWVPLLRLKSENQKERLAFWTKHLGNDAIAGAWVFATFGVLSGILVIPLVVLQPGSMTNWFIFWSTIPFTVGSLLFVRASYPETMNSSFFFSSPATSTRSEETVGMDGVDAAIQTDLSPLLS